MEQGKKKSRRSYNKKSLESEFARKADIIDAFQHYIDAGKISRPLFMPSFQKMSKQEILSYVKPEYCPDFALYLRGKKKELEDKYNNTTSNQKTIASQIQKFSKKHILKTLNEKGIVLNKKQTMRIDELSFEVALNPQANDVLKHLNNNYQPKVKDSQKESEENEPSTKKSEKSEKKNNKKSIQSASPKKKKTKISNIKKRKINNKKSQTNDSEDDSDNDQSSEDDSSDSGSDNGNESADNSSSEESSQDEREKNKESRKRKKEKPHKKSRSSKQKTITKNIKSQSFDEKEVRALDKKIQSLQKVIDKLKHQKKMDSSSEEETEDRRYSRGPVKLRFKKIK